MRKLIALALVAGCARAALELAAPPPFEAAPPPQYAPAYGRAGDRVEAPFNRAGERFQPEALPADLAPAALDQATPEDDDCHRDGTRHDRGERGEPTCEDP